MVKRVTRNQKPETRNKTTKKTIKKQEAGNRKLETSSEFLVPLTELLEAGCHFGHQTRRWNPKMSSFIYCAKDGVHIFDLVKTAKCLQEACLAAKQITSEGREIVFVGTKRQAQAVVKENFRNGEFASLAVDRYDYLVPFPINFIQLITVFACQLFYLAQVNNS